MIYYVVTKMIDENLITFISSTVTGVVSYIIGNKRAKKELENQTLVNMEKSIEIYNTIIEDLKGEIESLLKKVDELEKKIDNLKKENDELKDMLARHDARLKDNNKN